VSALNEIARQHQLTLNTLVRGAWALVLAKLGETDDVLFGAAVSGRPSDLAGVETIVGSFINNLPIRIRLDVRESLLPWLQRLQLQQLATQPYEYVSPVQIHVWSELADNEPLFDTLLIFQPSLDSARISKGDLALTKLHGNLATVYPLTLSVVEEDVELRFLAVYEAQHLGQDRAAQLVGDLVSLLEKIADKPNQTLGELIGVSAMKSGQTSPELSAKTRHSANSKVEQPVWSTRSQAIGSEKEVEQKLIGVWQDVLGVAPINLAAGHAAVYPH
jgi:non-ribosomal peptide synthetase component F